MPPSCVTASWIFTPVPSICHNSPKPSNGFSRNPSSIQCNNPLLWTDTVRPRGWKRQGLRPQGAYGGAGAHVQNSKGRVGSDRRNLGTVASFLCKCQGRPEEGETNFRMGNPAGISSVVKDTLLSWFGQESLWIQFSVTPLSVLTLSSFWPHHIQWQTMISPEPPKIVLTS